MKKSISIILSLITITILLVNSLSTSGTPFGTQNVEYLLDPATNEYLPIRNVENDIDKLSPDQDLSEELKQSFNDRKKQSQTNSRSSTYSLPDMSNAPTPNGVGYGFFYLDTFQYGFTTGTNIYYDAICPSSLNGTFTDFLYLTSMNRAAKGVEPVIVYYNGQDNFSFWVFDWAREDGDRFQSGIAFANLTNYLTTKTINGVSYQCITIQNKTVQISSTQWQNVVWLKNYTTNTFDQVYSNTYTATIEDQRDDHYGSWGPIVEVSQNTYYGDMNTVGFYNINLMTKTSDITSSTWSGWQLLSSSMCEIVDQDRGFSLVYFQPNHTFLVN